MVALLEDELEGTTPTVGLRVSLALAGTRQRARSGGLPGDGASPGLRVQTGALIVLSGWAVVVLGGAGFATLSEHFMEAQAPQAQALARGAFTMAVALALCGGALVLVGAVLALPATLRFLRSCSAPLSPELIRKIEDVFASSVPVDGPPSVAACGVRWWPQPGWWEPPSGLRIGHGT